MKLQGTRDSVYKSRTKMGKPNERCSFHTYFGCIQPRTTPPHGRCAAPLGLSVTVRRWTAIVWDWVTSPSYHFLPPPRTSWQQQGLMASENDVGDDNYGDVIIFPVFIVLVATSPVGPHRRWHAIVQRRWRQALFCFLLFVSGFAPCDVVPPSSSGTDQRLVIIVVHALLIREPRRVRANIQRV